MKPNKIIDEIKKLKRPEYNDFLDGLNKELGIFFEGPTDGEELYVPPPYVLYLNGVAYEDKAKVMAIIRKLYNVNLDEAKQMINQAPIALAEEEYEEPLLEMQKELDRCGAITSIE